MADKPTTMAESFKTMDGTTIRKLILEAQNYLHQETYRAFIAVLKAAVGLKLDAHILAPRDQEPRFEMRVVTTQEHWRNVGKLLSAMGSAFDKAGIPLAVHVTGASPTGRMSAVFHTSEFHPKFAFLIADVDDDYISVEDVLAYLEPPQADDDAHPDK